MWLYIIVPVLLPSLMKRSPSHKKITHLSTDGKTTSPTKDLSKTLDNMGFLGSFQLTSMIQNKVSILLSELFPRRAVKQPESAPGGNPDMTTLMCAYIFFGLSICIVPTLSLFHMFLVMITFLVTMLWIISIVAYIYATGVKLYLYWCTNFFLVCVNAEISPPIYFNI